MKTIKDEVIDCVGFWASASLGHPTSRHDLRHDLNLSEVQIGDIVSMVKRRLGILINDNEFRVIETVGDIIRIAEEKKAAKA
ncbi:MAG: acyl carrier protein [Lactobacillaceae bacterium]|jgi:acyl carrier protein|nr:acyl carrier protein [Lactobacillaceae bacterium]